ncbi:unnamed protein product [Owenia fusiformis]|uniref:Pyruvate kinase C-terminal domain-containing protein n=1 Tax=Owenia fusiformis TaxID=6347 RepID=A0A8S4P5T3_OWEFU|nr:unnamed protein product [Owenia fusiformis]
MYKKMNSSMIHFKIYQVYKFISFSEAKQSEWTDDVDKRINSTIILCRDRQFAHPGDSVVLVTGWKAGSGSTNTCRIVQVPDENNTIPSIGGLQLADYSD